VLASNVADREFVKVNVLVSNVVDRGFVKVNVLVSNVVDRALEATHNNFIVLGFTQTSLKPTIYYIRGEHVNLYKPTIYHIRDEHVNCKLVYH
jgi:hypothetical protein